MADRSRCEPRLIDPRPLILTARMAPEAQAIFQRRRTAHFPPERNVVPAHLTLFHQLPGSELVGVEHRLKAAAREVAPVEVEVTELRPLGGGVTYALCSNDLAMLRAELADHWQTLLTAQDRQGWRPHVTVQNKVAPAAAKALLAELSASFAPWCFRVTGLLLWRYLGGPWEAVREFAFRVSSPARDRRS